MLMNKDGNAIRSILYASDGTYAQDNKYLLRAIQESDKEDYLRYYREDPAWKQFFNNPELDPTERLWQAFIHPGIINTVIIRKEDGAYCGYCGLQEFLSSETPELSIEIMPEFQHQGIGTAVVPMLMNHYAEMTGTHEFIAKVSPENRPSQGLMKKLGAIPSGTARLPGFSDDVLQLIETVYTPQTEAEKSLLEEFGATLNELRSQVLVFRFTVE